VPSLELRAQPLGRPWTPFGTDLRRGINIEGLQCSVDAWGPLDLTCVLRRSPRVSWPDLQYGTPVELDVGGDRLWAGRIKNTPGTDGDDRQVAIQAEGWQFALDDRPYTQGFVENDIGQWADIRSNLACDLAYQRATWQLSSDPGGGLVVTAPNNGAIEAQSRGGFLLDMGPSKTAVGISFTYATSANNGNTSIAIGAATSGVGVTALSNAGSGAFAFPATFNTAGPAFYQTTFSASRYIWIGAWNTGGVASGTLPADLWMRVSGITVFCSNSYNASGVSTLKSSDIVRDAIARVPQISTDTSLVGTSTFVLPKFSVDEQTPRAAATAANAFQDWQLRVRADLRAEYRARPTAPILFLTDQSLFDDTSAGSGADVYNEARYVGTGPDGLPVVVTRTRSAAGLPATIPDRRGYTKAFTIDSNATLTAAAASQLCDVFLAQHNTMPFQGTIHATSRKAVALSAGGVQVPPAKLLRYGGEKVSFKHLIDPDTGALGRDGRIAQVTYSADTDSAEVAIDSTSGSYEAITARLAVVTSR
jgi:hypothetical protein